MKTSYIYLQYSNYNGYTLNPLNPSNKDFNKKKNSKRIVMIAFTYIESNRRLDIDFHKSGKGGGSEEGQKAYLEDDIVEVFAKESLIPHNLCGERKSSLASVATRRIFETFGRRETPSCGGCSLRDAPSFRQKRPNLLLSSVWGGSLSRQLRRSHTREARFRW